MKFIITVLIVLLSCDIYQILVYQQLVPKLAWAVDTLKINVIANRQQWRACKRFRWCDEHHASAKWGILSIGESHWEG